jgi:hypothetical protein
VTNELANLILSSAPLVHRRALTVAALECQRQVNQIDFLSCSLTQWSNKRSSCLLKAVLRRGLLVEDALSLPGVKISNAAAIRLQIRLTGDWEWSEDGFWSFGQFILFHFLLVFELFCWQRIWRPVLPDWNERRAWKTGGF